MQGVELLFPGGLKFPVAALTLLNALDDGRKPVCSFQHLALCFVEHRPGQVGFGLGPQFFGLQTGHHPGALPLQGLVGGAQLLVFILDGGRHVAGQDLRRVVVERRRGYHFGAQPGPGAGAVLGNQTEGVGQQRRVGGVLAQAFGAAVAHQAPPGDVLHTPQQGAQRIGFHLHVSFPVWYTSV